MNLIPKTPAARARIHPLGIETIDSVAAGKASEGAYGLRPQDLRSAYFPSEQPDAPVAEPQTIALVDVYNDLDAEADLKVYDEEFGLPECTSANGCFSQVNQDGELEHLPFPKSEQVRQESESACMSTTEGENLEELEAREADCAELQRAGQWSSEISLDVQVAHAVCRNCHILLVEADEPSSSSIEAAENTAANLGASVISDSFAGEEPPVDSEAFNHPGTVITAASGDSGYLNWNATGREGEEGIRAGDVNYPASSPHVVAVGGTRLSLDGPGGDWSSETAWDDSGSGCSATLPATEWQPQVPGWANVGCRGERAVVDVSADGDPYSGVAVYDSFPEVHKKEGGGIVTTTAGWHTSGGTSLASPIVASLFALAGGAHGVQYPAETLYSHLGSALLHDVTEGSNGKCDGDYSSGCTGSLSPPSTDCGFGASICNSRSGYDGPSGVGTPDGLDALRPSPPERGSGGLEAPITESCGQTSGSVQLCGTLNPHSNTRAGSFFAFNFGPSCVKGKRTPLMPEVEGMGIRVSSSELFGLQPDAEYAYCVVATNASGEAVGSALSFSTPPRAPETRPATDIASEAAVLGGRLGSDALATSWHFAFAPGIGCTGIGAETTPDHAQGAAGEEVQIQATDLQPSTAYTACLVASNAGGSTVGAPTTFKTLPAKPAIVSESASIESTTVVALAGSIRPGLADTHYYFEYGPTAAYGLTTVGGSLKPTIGELSVGPELVTGMRPSTTYHYRLAAANPSGESDGEDRTFTTPSDSQERPPPPSPRPPEPRRLFRELSVTAGRHGRSIRVHLSINFSGSQVAVALSLRPPSGAPAQTSTLGRAQRGSLALGPVAITVPLSLAGRRMLRRHRSLDVRVSIAVTAPTGIRSTASRSIRLTHG